MFKKLNIAPKLIISFILAVALASSAGVTAIFMLVRVDSNYSKALIENGFSQGEIGAFNTYLNKGGAVVRDIIMQPNQDEKNKSYQELQEISKKSNEALETLRPNCTTDEEIQLISNIEQGIQSYRVQRDAAVQLGLAGKDMEALEFFHANARPLLNELMQYADNLADVNVTLGNTVSSNLTRGTQATVFLIILIVVLAIAISVTFAVLVARSIATPIKAVQKAAMQLENGDLNIQVESDLGDEVGEMTRSFSKAAEKIRCYIADLSRGLTEISKGNFNVHPQEVYVGDFKALESAIGTIIYSLSETLGQINQASEQVAAGGEQVSCGAQALSQGATEQASSVEELAATINEISSQVTDTAANAQEASALAQEAGQQVEECNRQMHQMNSAMLEISQTSGEIGKIIKTIEDIAFQTNILALNAAVEAARAGAAGKGFAVVADEVRNLASKSAQAAKNTTALIEGAIRAIDTGTALANNTTSSLILVVEGTRKVNTTVDKISNATSLQANSIAQVTTGIDQISSVVQTNSATSEQSAAASEELSSQANLLKDLVGQFILLDGSLTTASSSTLLDAPVFSPKAPSTHSFATQAKSLSTSSQINASVSDW